LLFQGKIAFISSYATFSPGKNWETIRTTIIYNDANVKIAGHHQELLLVLMVLLIKQQRILLL
jgi:Transketolase, C-terminal subunit